jgi:sensitive to high expression protein 9
MEKIVSLAWPIIEAGNTVFNKVTGYTEILERKARVSAKGEEVARLRSALKEAKVVYEGSIEDRRKCQKEINSLLQRKDVWIDSDVIRFTELFKRDLTLEQHESAAKSMYKSASDHFEQSQIEFLKYVTSKKGLHHK